MNLFHPLDFAALVRFSSNPFSHLAHRRGCDGRELLLDEYEELLSADWMELLRQVLYSVLDQMSPYASTFDIRRSPNIFTDLCCQGLTMISTLLALGLLVCPETIACWVDAIGARTLPTLHSLAPLPSPSPHPTPPSLAHKDESVVTAITNSGTGILTIYPFERMREGGVFGEGKERMGAARGLPT